MISLAEEGLRKIERKVKEEQDKDYEFLKGLHIESQTSRQGKVVVEITIM